ncbi:hypothetical protein PSY31_23360, partial [Shigella flexneri]|nr:hypothetical protein [Shigella flexneri]
MDVVATLVNEVAKTEGTVNDSRMMVRQARQALLANEKDLAVNAKQLMEQSINLNHYEVEPMEDS